MKTEKKDLKIKVLLLITGSIGAVRIPLLVSQLVKSNYEIKCVVSENAEKLIQPLSLSILSRNPCILDKDQWSYHQSKPLHIDLCHWADVLIIAPLTATTLSKWVTGNADGLVSSILIANEMKKNLKGDFVFHRGSSFVNEINNKFKILNNQEKPKPFSPILFFFGTITSVNIIECVSEPLIPSLSSFLPTITPSVSFSTMNALIPLCPKE